MDLQEIATKMFMDKIGTDLDTSAVSKALSELIGSRQDLDIAGLVSQFTSGGLADAAKSWLGDGANQTVSAEQITQGLGADKLGSFARALGLSQGDAANSLADLLPNLIDQSSKGGSLLDSVGGIGGLASKLLK